MDDITTIENILSNVRKAHRLVFEYQKRMLDLMQLVRNQYDFKSLAGKKHFSKPLHNTEKFSKDNKDANIDIFEKIWAWDFIYSYEMEYYFGEKTKNGLKCRLSVFQITDNGFFMRDGFEKENGREDADKCITEKFWDADESSSYLIFVTEVSKENIGSSKFFPDVQKYIMELYGKDNDRLINNKEFEGHTLVAKRYPISEFFDKNSSNKCLNEYAGIVKSETEFCLL